MPPSKTELQDQSDLFGEGSESWCDAQNPLPIANILPSDLDGSRGRFRRPGCDSMLDAVNDYEAILSWIATKGTSNGVQRRPASDGEGMNTHAGVAVSNTQRAYLREAERLLLWATLARGKPLSSLSHDDCVAYSNFLVNPAPAARWCGPRAAPRWSAQWRPFEGPLSASARRQALVILTNLFGFLADKCYLSGNPMAGIRSPRDGLPKIDAGRSFTQRQWAMIEQQLAELPSTPLQQRLGFSLRFLYGTGLRLSELVAAKLDDLEQIEVAGNLVSGSTTEAWILNVNGKGGHRREVPIAGGLMAELEQYLRVRGLDANPNACSNRGVALIGHVTPQGNHRLPVAAANEVGAPIAGLSASTIYKSFKGFFASVALGRRAQADAAGARKFERASTHWLRHTHASHAIARGVPLEIAQQNLGHASLATTTVYVRTERSRRVRAMETFWSDVSGASAPDLTSSD